MADERSVRFIAMQCFSNVTRLSVCGRFQEALKSITELVDKIPETVEYLKECTVYVIDEMSRSCDQQTAKVALERNLPLLSRFPDISAVYAAFGKLALTAESYDAAWVFLGTALRLDPSDAAAEAAFDDVKHALVPRWHYRMLNDIKRNSAFNEALKRTIKPGDSVFDLGCGCGLLSFYAKQAGAGEVAACDSDPIMCDIARKTLSEEGISVLEGHSSRITPAHTADVLVSEIFDSALLGEGALQSLADAKSRLLSPGGKIIPSSAKLYVRGVRSHALARKHRLLRSTGDALESLIDWTGVNLHSPQSGPYDAEDLTTFRDAVYTTEPGVAFGVDFQDDERLQSLARTGETSVTQLKVTRPGSIDAFVGWFELKLTEGVSLTTDPEDPDRCDAWHCAVFPLRRETKLRDGHVTVKTVCHKDRLELVLESPEPDDLSVPETVLTFLNDSDYVNTLVASVAAACVHFAQVFNFETVNILDFSPFPVVGLSMVKRGAKKLFCSKDASDVIERIAHRNGIDTDRISTFDLFEGEHCEMVVFNCIDDTGRLNSVRIKDQKKLASTNLKKKGIALPHKIRMVARLLHSDRLDLWNRIDNSNLLTNGKFNGADPLNIYQVSQNSFPASDRFERIYLSDETTLFPDCMESRDCKTIQTKITDDGIVNAVQCYYKIQLLQDGDEISTDRPNSHINNVFHLIDPPIAVKKGDTLNVLCCTDVLASSVKIVLDVDN